MTILRIIIIQEPIRRQIKRKVDPPLIIGTKHKRAGVLSEIGFVGYHRRG